MQSNQTHTFSQVPKAEIPRSSFDRSHGYKTTFDAGYLIPILIDEALPGDTFKLKMTGFARLATPIFPIMDNMFMDTHFFSVPVRLLWKNWQKFNGEQEAPGDSTDFVIPQVVASATGFPALSIYDYMGLPTTVPNLSVNCLPLRAYMLIYNEWFRDQNLIPSRNTFIDSDGPQAMTNFALERRGKRHDYFTSALPWPQKGPGVMVPLGTTAPVISSNINPTISDIGGAWTNRPVAVTGVSANSYMVASGALTGAAVGAVWGNQTGLVADLSTASAATINSLRQAFQIQKIFERDARGGTRYTEIIKAHFGVSSPDARLQRPEYLGGGSSSVNVSPIPQTSATGVNADTPQGNLAAMGTAHLRNHGFTASFTEHCYIIGLVSVRADLTYQQGLNRLWSRQTRFEFYLPALAHIGEQAVLRKEIFTTGIPAQDEIVFGYQERFAEYRYKPSQITGLFRSNHPQSLDAWHLSQDFASAPVLGYSFISEDPPIDRIIAVNTEPHFLFDSFFQMHCARPMPVYGVPGLIDHF